MRGEDGELVGAESELKEIWKSYFEQLMNNEAEGEAVVTSMGTVAGRGRVPMCHDGYLYIYIYGMLPSSETREESIWIVLGEKQTRKNFAPFGD